MGGLPTSFLVVAAFVVLAVGLIAYFVSKQLQFRRHKRKGEEAFQRGDYVSAVDLFGRAEALWELNVSNQTMTSYQHDLSTLDELLNRLEAAARAGGIELTVGEYRDAVKAMKAEFQGRGVGERASTGKTYASTFMRLKNAQSALREQLRANRTRRCLAQTG